MTGLYTDEFMRFQSKPVKSVVGHAWQSGKGRLIRKSLNDFLHSPHRNSLLYDLSHALIIADKMIGTLIN